MRPSDESRFKRLGDERLRSIGLAFLDERAGKVQPPVGVFRLRLRDLAERVLCTLEVSLLKQTDAPVVPPLAVGLQRNRIPLRPRLAVAQRNRRLRFRKGDDRQVWNAILDLARYVRRGYSRGRTSYSRLLDAALMSEAGCPGFGMPA